MRHHGDEQGVRAVRDADAVTSADVAREPLFKLRDLRPHDELPVIENRVDALAYRPFKLAKLRLEIDEFHG